MVVSLNVDEILLDLLPRTARHLNIYCVQNGVTGQRNGLINRLEEKRGEWNNSASKWRETPPCSACGVE